MKAPDNPQHPLIRGQVEIGEHARKVSALYLKFWERRADRRWVDPLRFRFERYAGMQQDEREIWASPSRARVAWFKDLDGNTLSITQHDQGLLARRRVSPRFSTAAEFATAIP